MTAVSFFVNRLYVLAADNRVAYDERYHHGINIIRKRSVKAVLSA